MVSNLLEDWSFLGCRLPTILLSCGPPTDLVLASSEAGIFPASTALVHFFSSSVISSSSVGLPQAWTAEHQRRTLVVESRLAIQMHDPGGDVADVTLGLGETFLGPQCVTYRPIATDEVGLVLIEPESTAHTGAFQSELRVDISDRAHI